MIIEQNFHLPQKFQTLATKSSATTKALQEKMEKAKSLIKDQCCLESSSREIALIEKLTTKILASYNKAIIVAVGGAMSSSRSFTACKNYQSEEFQLIYSDSMNTQKQAAIFTEDNLRDSAVIIISRSGETAETISQTHIIIDRYYQYFGKDYSLGKHFFIITEGDNLLKKIAHRIEANIFDYISKTGKFSAFSMVGLLPARLIDLSPKEIIDGAMLTLASPKNAIEAAWLNYQLLPIGYNINILSHYNDIFDYILTWYTQISSEIIAKKDRGFTSIVTGMFDQHGLWQLFLAGPADKYFTFLISEDKSNISEVNQLIEKTYYQSNLKRLKEREAPVRELIIDKVDSEHIGALAMQFLLEMVILADLLDVSPILHPDIDKSKKLLSQIYSTYLKNK